MLQATNVVDEPINENSAPVYMWLNMGINLETFGFWDNWQSYTIYQQDANYNKAESTQLFKEEISHKLSEASLRDVVKMYYKKSFGPGQKEHTRWNDMDLGMMDHPVTVEE